MEGKTDNTGNQYTFPDGTIIDFGNRDPQKCLDDYLEWQNRKTETAPNTDNPLLDEIKTKLRIFQDYTASWGFPMNRPVHEEGLDNIAREIQLLVLKERKAEMQLFKPVAESWVEKHHSYLGVNYLNKRLAELDHKIKEIQ